MEKEAYILILKKQQSLLLKKMILEGYSESALNTYKRVTKIYIDSFESSYALSIPPNINEARSILPNVLKEISTKNKYAEKIIETFLTHLRRARKLTKSSVIDRLSPKDRLQREELLKNYTSYLVTYWPSPIKVVHFKS